MTTPEDRALLEAAARLLSSKLRSSQELRDVVLALGQWLIAEVERSASTDEAPGSAAAEEPAGAPASSPATAADADPDRPGSATTLGRLDRPAPAAIRGPREVPPPLTLGTAITRATPPGGPRPAEPEAPAARTADVDLALIGRRARLKAASCRNFVPLRDARDNLYHDPDAAEREQECLAVMREQIAEGRAMEGCFLWVYWRDQSPPEDGTLLRIASCYEALADAADLTRSVLPADPEAAPQGLIDAMQLLAEAHCMLRIALEPSWLTSPDNDQNETHHWLRHQTAHRRILLPDYLRSDDVADPAMADDLRRRILEVGAATRSERAAEQKVLQAFRKIRWHAKQILNAPDEDRTEDYAKIGNAIASLLEMGVRPSDTRFREHLPTEVAAAFPASQMSSAVVQEAIHYTLERATPTEDENGWTDNEAERIADSAEIRRAAELIGGRSVVLIGGEPRNDQRERIESTLHTTVIWPALNEHGPGEPMRAPIARPEVVAVFVIKRLAGHLHIDEAREYARAAGKPCITLTHGYNPAQIARALLGQAADRLAPTA